MYNANTTCSIKLNSNGFLKTTYEFKGFGTGTTTVTHNAGTSYNFSNNTTLYAIWKSSSVKTCRVEASENVSETQSRCYSDCTSAGGGSACDTNCIYDNIYKFLYNECCSRVGGCTE